MTYAELTAALAVFGYSAEDRPTRAQVKRRHRELVRQHHPDSRHDAPAAAIQKVNAAAAVITAYLDSYAFSFSEEEFYLQNPDARLAMQFGFDPWGSR